MASRWDGDVGKIGDFNSKREGKKVSFRMPKGKREEGDYSCRQFDESKRGSRKPKPAGSADLYSPEVVYNYKSQWARYERALDLRPDSIEEGLKESYYKFHSCDAPDGFWKVTVKQGATFLKLAKSILTIVCPQPYRLTGGESDGTSFVWQQIAGNRTVVFSPETELNTTINMLNTCLPGTGCDSGTSLPIVLRVSVEGEPALFDNLTIYNTPTSTLFGNSFRSNGVGVNPCKIVDFVTPAPVYQNRGYFNQGEPVNFTWNLPKCETQWVTATTWQSNTNGEYLDIERFPVGEEHLFDAELRTYYRIKTEFLIEGFKREVTYSNPIYVDTANRKLTFGDDTQRGISFRVGQTRSLRVVPEFEVIQQTSPNRGVSFVYGKSSSRRGELNVQQVNITDTLNAGISFTPEKTRYTKEAQGSVVIG